ncbi:MAG: hypothetical protein ABSF44_13110 [Candidatus Bathyarchaeia archaeon]
MEYIVDPNHKNTTKVIGKACITCQVRIIEGNYVVTKHREMPQNQMPYTGDFTNGASWRSMQLYHLAIEKVRHDSFIFDIILSISKSAFGFRSLIFP